MGLQGALRSMRAEIRRAEREAQSGSESTTSNRNNSPKCRSWRPPHTRWRSSRTTLMSSQQSTPIVDRSGLGSDSVSICSGRTAEYVSPRGQGEENA